MRRRLHPRLSIVTSRSAPALVVLVALALLTWYVPTVVGGRQASMTPGAIHAVTADAAKSFSGGKETEPLAPGRPPGQLVESVELRRALSRWHVMGDAQAQRADEGLILSPEHGIVASAPFQLRRGTFEVIVNADVHVGGLQVGLASAASDLCVANAYLSFRNRGPGRFPLVLSVPRAGRYYLVFRGWPGTDRSEAVVRDISLRDISALVREDDAASYYKHEASLPPKGSWGSGAVESRWSFEHGRPASWRVETGVETQQRTGGLSVRTRRDADYNLVSPEISLDPAVARFAVAVSGRVSYGGLAVSVLDVKRNTFIGHGLFWFRQAGPYVFAFNPGTATRIRLILANWTPPHASWSSSWRIRAVTVKSF
jgi:hypothetical protein